jgi:hypothetical protein
MKLTENFSLEEFLVSQTAIRHGINMDPPVDVIENLRRLCVDILQPARDILGVPFSISSGYRPLELNELIGGSTTSAHPYGRAADVIPHRPITPLKLAETIRDMELPYDQVIQEFGRWVHIGISEEEIDVRMEELTAFKEKGQTKYEHGLREV